MESLILPDSNIFIGALRAGMDPFTQFVPGLEEREYCTCGMVVMEVCRGVRDPGLLRRIKGNFAVMIYVPTTNQIWERATQLAWSLDRQGVVLPAQDLLIAACALHAGATVFTHDAHFRSVPGLNVTDALA